MEDISRILRRKKYKLTAQTTFEETTHILKIGQFNMRRFDAEDYEEYAIITVWNVTGPITEENTLMGANVCSIY